LQISRVAEHVPRRIMIDAETLYRQLGELLISVPDFYKPGPLSPDGHEWLARAYALVKAGDDFEDTNRMKWLTQNLDQLMERPPALEEMLKIMRRTAAVAEVASPIAVRGSFIHAGNVFNAMTVLGKVFRSATEDVLVVDPYMDDKALSDFLRMVPEGVPIRLLSDQFHPKETLRPASERWQQQYASTRPLTVKLAAPRSLHDRLIIIDGSTVYVSTQSLNALAVRSPASIMRADPEMAQLKIEAYQLIWDNAASL
jgi:hypothetical protein